MRAFLLVCACLLVPVVVQAQSEPPLTEILTRLGYTIDVKGDLSDVQLFVKADPNKPVTHKPISAFGLIKDCHGGWYQPGDDAPKKSALWLTPAEKNKQDAPPIAEGGKTEFDPGSKPFGLWVSTTGFQNETVYSEKPLQSMIKRFGTDHHKARVYPAKNKDGVIPNTYIIGWEYSTNNDYQDIVTVVTNVTPAK